jgi:hypothetical protein
LEQFRKYNKEEDRIILDDKYLFAFTKSDGFNDRLLGAELVISYDYEYIFELNAFNHEKITNNNSNSLFLEGTVSGELLKHFENLLNAEYLKLKRYYDYETFIIDDIGGQQYLINLDEKTTNIHIVDGLPEEYFKSETEKILYKFNCFLKNWCDQEYHNWINK